MIFGQGQGGRTVLGAGRQSSSRRDLMTLGVMAALVLGILAYWTLGRAQRRMERDAPAPAPGESSEVLTVEEDDPYKAKAKKNLERDLAESGGAAGGSRGGGAASHSVTPENRRWLTEQMEADEAERSKFLPMLEKFTPLEYDAVRGFRALMQDQVASGFRPKVAAPGSAGDGMVVDAGPEGLTVEAAGGKKTKLAWDKVEASDAFRIALEMPLPEAADAKARHHIFLAQLATLAGKAARAAEFRLKAATFHFQDEIGKDAPEGAKALYDAARALVDERSASPLEKESDRDALALDILHLARLASAAGMESDSADYAARAVALDPTLEEEAAGGATKGLDRWLLENESWAWDPDDMNRADAQTANDLAGDAKAVLHIYRYMRTLGDERLARAAQEEPSYARLLNLPRQTRGRIYRAECGLIRSHTTMRFTKRPDHVDSGVQEVEFLFLSAKDSPGGIYLVCVPRATRFRQGDFLSVTGVFLRRWPYQKPNGKWRWIPWVVASKVEKIKLRGTKGWGAFIFVLLGLGGVGAIALFFAARREWRELTASRDRLHSRRRGGRNMIRRKVAGAMAASGDKSKPDDGDPAEAGDADATKAGDGDAAEPASEPDAGGSAPDADDKKD